jgi:hypothetical protein
MLQAIERLIGSRLPTEVRSVPVEPGTRDITERRPQRGRRPQGQSAPHRPEGRPGGQGPHSAHGPRRPQGPGRPQRRVRDAARG